MGKILGESSFLDKNTGTILLLAVFCFPVTPWCGWLVVCLVLFLFCFISLLLLFSVLAGAGVEMGRWGESFLFHRLVGPVVKASASRAEDPGFECRLSRDFSGVESYQ